MNSRIVPHSQCPPDVSVHSGKYFSLLGSTFKPRIDSHHGDTWDSPVGKPRASSRVETGMSGNFLSCSKGVKDPLEVPEVTCH